MPCHCITSKTPVSINLQLQTTCILTFNLSNNKLVNKKCPIWFTPSCISIPSFVLVCGHLITPALFIKISSRWCSKTNYVSCENNLSEVMFRNLISCNKLSSIHLGNKIPFSLFLNGTSQILVHVNNINLVKVKTSQWKIKKLHWTLVKRDVLEQSSPNFSLAAHHNLSDTCDGTPQI